MNSTHFHHTLMDVIKCSCVMCGRASEAKKSTYSRPGDESVAPRIVHGPFSSPHFGHGCCVNGGKSTDGLDHFMPSAEVAYTDLLYHDSFTGAAGGVIMSG